jgi:hypothetical protein
MIGFHLSFARKETVYNRHIGYFPSGPVGLVKKALVLLLFKNDYLPGACIL